MARAAPGVAAADPRRSRKPRGGTARHAGSARRLARFGCANRIAVIGRCFPARAVIVVDGARCRKARYLTTARARPAEVVALVVRDVETRRDVDIGWRVQVAPIDPLPVGVRAAVTARVVATPTDRQKAPERNHRRSSTPHAPRIRQSQPAPSRPRRTGLFGEEPRALRLGSRRKGARGRDRAARVGERSLAPGPCLKMGSGEVGAFTPPASSRAAR